MVYSGALMVLFLDKDEWNLDMRATVSSVVKLSLSACRFGNAVISADLSH